MKMRRRPDSDKLRAVSMIPRGAGHIVIALLLLFCCAAIAFASGEAVNVGIGALPAGKSITLFFDVTVDRNLPLARTSVQQQGTVSGSNFSDVLTNDPDTVTPADPTITYIDSVPPIAGFGKALNFDGISQYLEIPDSGALNSADYTIEAWVRPETVRPSTLIFRTDASVSGHANALYIDGSGRFVHYTYDTAGHAVTGVTTVEAGTWYHVAGTVSSGTMRLYVNGIEEGTAVSGLGALWTGGDRYLAAYGTGTLGVNYFDGQMDEVRIWDTGLPQPLIEAWMFRGIDATHTNEADLAAYFRFDETAGVTAADEAGGHDGTIMNGALRVDSSVNELYTSEDTAVGGMFVGSDEDGTSANGTNWAPSVSFVVVSATKGTVTPGSGNSFIYTPALNQNGDGTITYKMFDGTLYSNEFTTTVHISPVNDAPVIAAPGSIGVTEDTASALTGISLSDVDAGSGPVTATLSVPSGTLTATSGSGVTVVGSGSDILTLAGTISDIDAFVAAGSVTFTTALNATANVTLTVQIDDGGNTGSGGSKSDSATVTLTVAAVNDAPALTVPVSISVSEDVAGVIAGISFSDADAGSGNVTATFSVPTGTLAAASGSGVTTGGSGSGTLTLAGTIANINAFIAGGSVTFTTALNGTANVTLTVSINDNGNTGSGGSKSDSATVTLTVTAVNDAPVLNPIGNKTVDELVLLTFTASATDPDLPANTLTFSLAPGAPAGAAIDPSAGVFTWTPTEAQGPGVYTVTIRVTDNGTPSLSASETISITVNEVCTSGSLTVTSVADTGEGTLRQAIPDLCPGGVISFAIPGAGPHSIMLTSGELQISKDMTISGPGAADLIISGGGSQRVFSVGAGNAFILRNLTVSAGAAGSGAGLLNNGGAVTIQACEFTSCTSNNGGAIHNQSGTLTITGSTFSGNTALNGGGLFNDLGSAFITNSTITGNTAPEPTTGTGGGIYNGGGTITLVNCTISGNTAAAADGGIHNGSGTATLRNSIVAGNTADAGPDLGGGTFISEGYNLIQSTGAATFSGPATGDIYGQNPLLDTLRINGGAARTLALLSGSPAINSVPAGTNGCGTTLTSDQRSTSRPQGSGCDIGAYEFIPDTTTALVSSLNPSVYGDAVIFTATVTDSEAASSPAGTVTFKDGLADIAACTGISLSAGGAACTLSSLTGGGHAITASYSGGGSFSGSVSNTVSQAVNRADQSITFTSPADMPADTAPFPLSASAGPGLVVSFESRTLSVCTVSGNTVTLTHLAGPCTIRATQAGDTNYNAATLADRSFGVTPAALDHIVVSPAAATISAGGSQVYTTEGFDQYNNSLGDITATTAFGMTPDGSCTGSSCSATISGTHTVTGSRSGKTATGSLTVNPGAAASFSVGGPAGATGGLAFSLTVTAKDAFNNTVPGYSGAIQFWSTDAQAGLPAVYTFVAGDNGARIFTGGVTLKTAGTQTVSATDTLNSSITGSASIAVNLFAITGTVVAGNGTIACAPSALIYGDGFTCTLCADKGYDLNRLYDNGANRTSSCSVTGNCYAYPFSGVTSDHVVKAAYLNFPVIILFGSSSDSFPTIQSAVNASQNGDRIQSQGIVFTENLQINRPGVAASLEGGYDSGFNSSAGHTVMTGSLTLIDGTITIQGITIQ